MKCPSKKCKGNISHSVLPDGTLIYTCCTCSYSREIKKRVREQGKKLWINLYSSKHASVIDVQGAYKTKEIAEERISIHLGKYLRTISFTCFVDLDEFKTVERVVL